MRNEATDWMHDYETALLDNNVNVNRLVSIASEHFPKRLYRYGSFEKPGWESVLFHGIVQVSSPYYFNDPFDCELSLTNDIVQLESVKERLIKDLKVMLKIKEYDINRIKYSDNLPEDIKIVVSHYGLKFKTDVFMDEVKRICDNGSVEFKKSIGAICFAEDPFSILMWSHYAHYHTGYCLMFEFPNDSLIFKSTYPVVYSHSRLKYSDQIKHHDDRWALKAMLCKSSDWSYEHEWRFLSVKIPPGSSVEFKFIPTVDLSKYIRGIYLGAKVDTEIETKVCEFGKQNNLQIFKMELSNEYYKLISKQIV